MDDKLDAPEFGDDDSDLEENYLPTYRRTRRASPQSAPRATARERVAPQ